METGDSAHPGGTLKLYLGISLQPTPCPPLLPSGLVYVRKPSTSLLSSPASAAGVTLVRFPLQLKAYLAFALGPKALRPRVRQSTSLLLSPALTHPSTKTTETPRLKAPRMKLAVANVESAVQTVNSIC